MKIISKVTHVPENADKYCPEEHWIIAVLVERNGCGFGDIVRCTEEPSDAVVEHVKEAKGKYLLDLLDDCEIKDCDD